MFIPYKKLAKLSLNLDKLSCINCRCMKFASRSAIESDSSANAGSRDSNAKPEEVSPDAIPWKDVRELERRGVVGRDERLLRDCEVERGLLVLSIFAMFSSDAVQSCKKRMP